MNKKQSKAYVISMEFLKQAEKEGILRRRTRETKEGLTYDNYADEWVITTTGKFAYVNTKIFDDLSPKATIMVCKIMAELKNNNTLWLFDQRNNTRHSGVISELRKKGVLIKTETINIHYVNPFFIRAGMLGNTIFRMLHLLQNSSTVTTDHIKKLAWKGKAKASGMDYLTGDL
jgi:hypothetical protein